jgi:lysophospholipase L1-like esterase
VVVFLIGINDMGRDQMPGLVTPYDENLTDRGRTVRPLFDVVADHSEVGSLLYNLDRSLRAWLLGFSHVIVDSVGRGQPFNVFVGDRGVNAQGLLDRFDAFQPGYRERLKTLIDEVRKHGITPILVTQPFLWGDEVDPTTGHDLGNLKETLLGESTTSLVYWKALEKYNATMRGVAETSGVTLVDLARMLPKDSFLYVDRMHFSNAGAAKVGKIIANAMCEKLQREFPKWVDRSAGDCGEAHKE